MLTVNDYFAKKLEISSVVIKQMFVTACYKLSGIHSCKQVKRNSVFNHKKQFFVEHKKGLISVAVKVDFAFKKLIFIIKKIGEG